MRLSSHISGLRTNKREIPARRTDLIARFQGYAISVVHTHSPISTFYNASCAFLPFAHANLPARVLPNRLKTKDACAAQILNIVIKVRPNLQCLRCATLSRVPIRMSTRRKFFMWLFNSPHSRLRQHLVRILAAILEGTRGIEAASIYPRYLAE